MTSSFFMGLTLAGSGSTNNKSLLLLICVELYLSDQFRGIISDMYQYWRTFPDSLISFPPQGALQNALTDANEPQLLHLKGCHLDFKDNKVNYLIVTQIYDLLIIHVLLLKWSGVLCESKMLPNNRWIHDYLYCFDCSP